jgi:DNA-binding transcriptional MerR regulator
MTARVGIGDFSRMTHLSVTALRHYHELGLLDPAEVDPGSGYRFYAPEQVQLAQVIRRFRDLGMPLDEIREVLRAPDAAARNRAIVAHMQRMEDELAATQSVVASLRRLLERTPTSIEIRHRLVSSTRALAICDRVGSADLDAWLGAAQREIDAVLATAAVPATGRVRRCTRRSSSSSRPVR